MQPQLSQSFEEAKTLSKQFMKINFQREHENYSPEHGCINKLGRLDIFNSE